MTEFTRWKKGSMADMTRRGILTFLRFISPYVLILIAVIGLEEFIYRQSVETLTQETAEVQMGMLENSMHAVDSMLGAVDDKAVEFSMNPQYRAMLFQADNEHENFYDYIEIWKTFRKASLSQDFIFDYVIYFRDADLLLTSENLSLDPADYYGDLMKYGDLSFGEWEQSMALAGRKGVLSPAVSLLLHGETERVIPYVRLLPFDFQNPKAVLQVYIREASVREVFSDYVLDNNGTVMIFNSAGETITCQGKGWDGVLPELEQPRGHLYLEPEKNEKWGAFLVYVQSQETDWTYVSVLPEEIVMSKVHEIRQNMILITLLVTAAILLISLLSSVWNLKSVQQIVKKVQGFGNHGDRFTDDYGVINSNLNSLLESHDRLTVNFQKQAARVINNVKLDLLLGKAADLQETVDTLDEIGFQVRRQHYCVAVMKITDPEDANAQKRSLREIMERLGNNDILAANYAIDRVLVLFMGDGAEAEFEALTEERVQQGMEQAGQQGIAGFCVVGPVVHSLEQIHRSAGAAVKAAMNIFYSGTNSVYFYDRMYRNYADVLYSADKEQKIINLVKQGDCEQLQQFLRQIIEKRRGDRNNALKMKGFYMQLCGTLNKVTEGPEENFYEQLETCCSEAEMEEYILQRYSAAAKQYGEKKDSRGNDAVLLIKDYITENYQNSSLCLAEIADRYNISEVYFSQTFKAVTGENFSVYLENIRMEKARELLLHTDMTVENIALEVGYNSINTFHKAFKRVNGITPGGFKKIHAGEKA